MWLLQNITGRLRTLNLFFKFFISGILLILIAGNVDFSRTMVALRTLPGAVVFLALLFQVASNSVAAFRWFLIMSKIGFSEPFSFYLRSFFKGAFFNQGLPTSIGGDAVRILDCTHSEQKNEDAVFGVFIDRIVGLAGLLLLNFFALLINRTLLPARIFLPLIIILCFLLAALVALFYLRNISFLDTHKYLSYLTRLSKRYQQVYESRSAIFLQTGLSIITHLLAMIAFFILGNGVGLHYTLETYLALVPPVILLTILPISFAGWGIREGAMIGFFILIGAEKSLVLSFSILYGLLALTASLPGLLIYLTQKNRL